MTFTLNIIIASLQQQTLLHHYTFDITQPSTNHLIYWLTIFLNKCLHNFQHQQHLLF